MSEAAVRTSFSALQIVGQAAATLHRRAAQGIYRPDVPMTGAYLKSCRLVLPQLGLATVLAYEDLQPHKERPPEECRFALHFCMVAMNEQVLRQFLERDRAQLLDEPGWHQRSAFAATIYGRDRKHVWARTENINGEDQFHAWLFLSANVNEKRWEPRRVSEGWPRAQGMRRLLEILDEH